jgi:hypothetical protein
MTKKERKVLVESLEKVLEKSNELFQNQTQPHAYIVGYLEGAIRAAIGELKD